MKAELISIIRRYQHHQTVGQLFVFDSTLNRLNVDDIGLLELPWQNNQRRISCIPEGTYTAIKHISPKFGECLWIQDVPNRSEILIHDKVNYVGSKNPRTGKSDLLGCGAPFLDLIDLNNDGVLDIAVKSSTLALQKILALCGTKVKIQISSKG